MGGIRLEHIDQEPLAIGQIQSYTNYPELLTLVPPQSSQEPGSLRTEFPDQHSDHSRPRPRRASEYVEQIQRTLWRGFERLRMIRMIDWIKNMLRK